MTSTVNGEMISVGDVEIYTETYGDGPPLFLVAGLGGRSQFWSHQIEALSKEYRVILHDHRGVGRSTPSKVVYGAIDMAEDLMALMDKMDIKSANFVGHSTGGAICQNITLNDPARVDKLVLSSSWAGPDAYFVHLFRTRREVLINCGPAAYLTIGTYLATPSWHLQKSMKSSQAFLEERMAAFPGLEVELSRLSAVLSHDLRTQLHRIEKPTLCIGARDDQITPIAYTEELARLIPNAELNILDRGGHFCPATLTEDYNERILAFLRT
jgi:aminoacrylate hydrolase